MKARKGKKEQSENKVHPYDFSLKKLTKYQKNVAKPIRPDLMAAGLIKAHGLDRAKKIVEPMTIKSFKDGQGNPVSINESSSYWVTVLQYLNKGLKNGTAS